MSLSLNTSGIIYQKKRLSNVDVTSMENIRDVRTMLERVENNLNSKLIQPLENYQVDNENSRNNSMGKLSKFRDRFNHSQNMQQKHLDSSSLSIYDKRLLNKYKDFYEEYLLGKNKSSAVTMDTMNQALGGYIQQNSQISQSKSQIDHSKLTFQQSTNLNTSGTQSKSLLGVSQLINMNKFGINSDSVSSNFKVKDFIKDSIKNFGQNIKQRNFQSNDLSTMLPQISINNQSYQNQQQDFLNSSLDRIQKPQFLNKIQSQEHQQNNDLLKSNFKYNYVTSSGYSQSKSEIKQRPRKNLNTSPSKPDDYFQSKRGQQKGFHHLLCAQEIHNNENKKQHGLMGEKLKQQNDQEMSERQHREKFGVKKKEVKEERLTTLERVKFDNPLGMMNQKISKWVKQHQQSESPSKTNALNESSQLQKQNSIMNKKSARKQELDILKFAKDLFKLWDTKEYGKIKLRVLIKNFIALGLAADEDVAFDFFKYIIKEEGAQNMPPEILKNKEVMLEEFVTLFKSQDYEDKILNVLNSEIRLKKENQENFQKQVILMRQLTNQNSRRNQSQVEESEFEEDLTVRTNFNSSQKMTESSNNRKKSKGIFQIETMNVFNESAKNRSSNQTRLSQSIQKVMGNLKKKKTSKFKTKSKISLQSSSDSDSEREFVQEMNRKYQPTRQEDQDLILKDYKVGLIRLEREQENIKQSNIYEDIQQDLRLKYQTFKDIITAETKIEEGRIIDQKERLIVIEKRKHFKQLLRHKYGQFGTKIFMTTLQKIFERELQEIKESKNFQMTPHLIIQNAQQSISILIKRLVKEVYKKQNQPTGGNGVKSDFKFPNEKLINMVDLVNEWWLQLDSMHQKEITKKDFAKFLLDKKLLRKEIEIDRVIKVLINEPLLEGTLKQSQFIKLFTKAILKGAIMNIYYYCNFVGRAGDDIVPTHLKVLKFQRSLLIGGLKNEQEMLGVDCNNVITGLLNQSKNENQSNLRQSGNDLLKTKNPIVTLSGIKEFMGRKMEQLAKVSQVLTEANKRTLQNIDLKQNYDVKSIMEEDIIKKQINLKNKKLYSFQIENQGEKEVFQERQKKQEITYKSSITRVSKIAQTQNA
eukprot:403361809